MLFILKGLLFLVFLGTVAAIALVVIGAAIAGGVAGVFTVFRDKNKPPS